MNTMTKIGILKEENDTRVCLNPTFVKKIISELKCDVLVEFQAGLLSGFEDEHYSQFGAQLRERNAVIKEADILLCINHVKSTLHIEAPKTLISILNPLYQIHLLSFYFDPNFTVYSLDLMPRSSKAQSMDVLSSMASLSGYKAVIKAAEIQINAIPMLTTAAGTVKPAKVLVLGAGVAGLQAIATAKRLGAIVDAFDVRKSAGEEIRSLGANFIEVEGSIENQASGGYAIEQTEDYLKKQKELIDKHVAAASIVISTANIPGKTAPILIDKASVGKMKSGSVIIDLAAEQGGNCVLTENGKTVEYNGVKIIGNSFLTSELQSSASNLLSTNYFNFLKHLLTTDAELHSTDPIINDCLTVKEGKIVNERVLSFINY